MKIDKVVVGKQYLYASHKTFYGVKCEVVEVDLAQRCVQIQYATAFNPNFRLWIKASKLRETEEETF